MAELNEDDAVDDVKGTKQRSPNYPMFSLKKAIELSKVMHDKYKKSVVPIHLAQAIWGYKEHSGSGNQAVGALKAFGLVEVDGKAKDRLVRLTDRAVRIVLGSPDRAEQLRKAASSPQIYEEILERYKAEESIPDDELLKHYLVWDREGSRFNIETVDGFLGDFRESLRYAGLKSTGIIEASNALCAYARLGDFVNVSAGPGKYKYKQNELRRVVGVSEDGSWVFIEGEPTGIPKDDVFVMSQNPNPVRGPQLPPVNPFKEQQAKSESLQGWNGPRISVDLARGNSIEIRLKAKITRKELDRIKNKVFALAELSFLVDEEADDYSDAELVPTNMGEAGTHSHPLIHGGPTGMMDNE